MRLHINSGGDVIALVSKQNKFRRNTWHDGATHMFFSSLAHNFAD